MAEIGTDINKAKQILVRGGLVAIPTETVYGLAGNALQEDAVASIFRVKNRPQFDPLIIHVPDIERAQHYTKEIPNHAVKLAQHFWPGPLTLVLKKTDVVPYLVTSGLDTVGVRCPDHALTRELLSSLPFPLAAPSANPFGYVSPTTAQHVQEQLGDKIDYILDGGSCRVGIESTIVGFEDEQPVIYRMGGLSIEAIEKIAGHVEVRTHSTSNPRSPGQLISHYAPRKKVYLGKIAELMLLHTTEKVGILSFSQNFNHPHQVILSEHGDIDEAAKHLFQALRTLDKMNIDCILTEFVPDIGLGRAINDRLRRAAAIQ